MSSEWLLFIKVFHLLTTLEGPHGIFKTVLKIQTLDHLFRLVNHHHINLIPWHHRVAIFHLFHYFVESLAFLRSDVSTRLLYFHTVDKVLCTNFGLHGIVSLQVAILLHIGSFDPFIKESVVEINYFVSTRETVFKVYVGVVNLHKFTQAKDVRLLLVVMDLFYVFRLLHLSVQLRGWTRLLLKPRVYPRLFDYWKFWSNVLLNYFFVFVFVLHHFRNSDMLGKFHLKRRGFIARTNKFAKFVKTVYHFIILIIKLWFLNLPTKFLSLRLTSQVFWSQWRKNAVTQAIDLTSFFTYEIIIIEILLDRPNILFLRIWTYDRIMTKTWASSWHDLTFPILAVFNSCLS